MGPIDLNQVPAFASVAVAGLSLAANVYQYWHARARRSGLERRGAVRSGLTSTLIALELATDECPAREGTDAFVHMERAYHALVELDCRLTEYAGAPLSVTTAVTRLIMDIRSVLRWRGDAIGRPSRIPEAASADLARLRADCARCGYTLRVYLSRLAA